MLIICDPVTKSEIVSHEVAASSIYGGLLGYIAWQYLHRVTPGDTVLIFDGARPRGNLALQLACEWGCKVITTADTIEDINYLSDLRVKIGECVGW